MSGAERQNVPKYVLNDIDRHGNRRWYYRRHGYQMVRLRAEPGTPEFDAQYEAAASGLCVVSDPPGCMVYFFRQANLVKIGFSTKPADRLSALRTASAKHIAWEYSTPGGRALESELHRKFAEFRVKREWFLFAPEIREWIANDHEARQARIREQKERLEALGLSPVRPPEKAWRKK